MQPPIYVVLLLQAANLVLLLLLSLTSWRAYRLSGSKPLVRFTCGFAGFGIAQLMALALELYTAYTVRIDSRNFDAFDVLFWGYYSLQIAGAAFLLSTFDRRKYRWVLAAGPVLLVAGPILQVVLLLLLFLIVIHAGLNHIERSRIGSVQTATGYCFLLIAHFLFLFDYVPLSPRNLWGELVASAGLIALWLAAARPHKAED